jgi:hypothetical protein
MNALEKDSLSVSPVSPDSGQVKIRVASRDSIEGLLRDCHGEKNVIHPYSLLAFPAPFDPFSETLELVEEVPADSPLSAYSESPIMETLSLTVPVTKETESPQGASPSRRDSLIDRLKNLIRRG